MDALAATRPVILFDQACVGRSTGEITPTFRGWADNVIAICGGAGIFPDRPSWFVMGGCAVQMVALAAPQLVRMLILAATIASAQSC